MTRITVRLAILTATAALLGACGSSSITAPDAPKCDGSLRSAPACRQSDFINPHVDFINPHV